MKLSEPKCPECGESAIGTVDWIPGCALFNGDPAEGTVEYSGSTECYWNGQITKHETHGSCCPPAEGRPMVQCDNGHEWPTEIEE